MGRRHPAWRLGNSWPYRVLVRLAILHSPTLEMLSAWNGVPCPRCERARRKGWTA